MIATVLPSHINGGIEVASSKSCAHRALILSALCKENTVLHNMNFCEDTEATVRCLSALGCGFGRSGGALSVLPGDVGASDTIRTLDCGESGSTLRFMLPLAAALGAQASFTGSARLMERPLSELTAVLSAHGADIGDAPLTTRGRLSGGEYRIAGNISSQYISGLLMALPLTKERCEIKIEGQKVSAGYVDMTIALMKRFGIETAVTSQGYLIPTQNGYLSPKKFIIEGDWSNAAFLLASGALSGDVTVSGLSIDSAQGDKRIYQILKEMGCDITECADGIRAKKSRLTAVSIDAEDIPDLVPVLSVLMAFANGISEITGVERLRQKESDRLSAIIEMLGVMGGKAWYSNGKLMVEGCFLHGARLSSYGDHRMVMAGTVAALAADGATEIEGAEAVNKSYPSFFETIGALGGEICLKN